MPTSIYGAVAVKEQNGKRKILIDSVNVVTAREGKSTENTPHPNQTGKAVVSESNADEEEGS
jgi:hypothetical protein